MAINLNLFSLATGSTTSRELPIDLDDLIAITESLNMEPSSHWEFVGPSNCRLFSRMSDKPLDPIQTDATGPFELMSSANRNSSLSTWPIWLAISKFTSANQVHLNSAMKQTFQVTQEFYENLYSFAAQQYYSVVEHIRCQSALNLDRKLVPAVLGSNRANKDDDLAIFVDTDSAGPQSLIRIIGKQQDPYWQYYEDCDRWGVEFTHLLDEARTIDTSVCSADGERIEIVDHLTQGSNSDVSPTRFSNTRFLISQHVGRWLVNGYLEKQASTSLLDWLRGTKLAHPGQSSIASAKTTLSK